jgi:hypothetical protein
MMATEDELTAEQREQIVLDGYAAGKKLAEIEREAGVPRSTLYWILDRHGVSPKRAKRRTRIIDDGKASTLLELIRHQDALIAEAEEALRLATVAINDVDEAHLASLAEMQQRLAEQARQLEWWQLHHPDERPPKVPRKRK